MRIKISVRNRSIQETQNIFCNFCLYPNTSKRKQKNKIIRIRPPRLRSPIICDLTKLVEYRLACKFNFNLKDFPNEFDFSLIEKHGWYKPANKGNNLYGVSRDHMISVRYGFDNNIDPKILSHPANCKLLPHAENHAKHTKNSITLEELEIKIITWNIKYQ